MLQRIFVVALVLLFLIHLSKECSRRRRRAPVYTPSPAAPIPPPRPPAPDPAPVNCKARYKYGLFRKISTCGGCGACIHVWRRQCRDNCGTAVANEECMRRGLGPPFTSNFKRLGVDCQVADNPCIKDSCGDKKSYKACYATEDSFACECREGFTNYGEEKSCVDVDECALSESKCRADGKLRDGVQSCFNTVGSYFCVCKPGYKLEGGRCVDRDECGNHKHDCDRTLGQCHNTIGSFRCSCIDGYHGSGRQDRCCDKKSFTIPVDAREIFSHHGKLPEHIRSPLHHIPDMELPVGRVSARAIYVTSTGVVVFLDEDQTGTRLDNAYHRSHCMSSICKSPDHCYRYVYYAYYKPHFRHSWYLSNWWWRQHTFHCFRICERLCRRLPTFSKPVPLQQASYHYRNLDHRFDFRTQIKVKGIFAPYWTNFYYGPKSKFMIYVKVNDKETPFNLKKKVPRSTFPNVFRYTMIIKFENVHDFKWKTDSMTFHVVIGVTDINTYGFVIFDDCQRWRCSGGPFANTQIGYWFRTSTGGSLSGQWWRLRRRSKVDFCNVRGLSGQRSDTFGSTANPFSFLGFTLSNFNPSYLLPASRCRRWIDANRVPRASCIRRFNRDGRGPCINTGSPQDIFRWWCPTTSDYIYMGFRHVNIPHLPYGIACHQTYESHVTWNHYRPICCYRWRRFVSGHSTTITGGEFRGVPAAMVTFGFVDEAYASLYRKQLYAYKSCCIDSRIYCREFLRQRPFSCARLWRDGASWAGDPHLITLDGLKFTFNGLGQFILLQGNKTDSVTAETHGIRIIALFQRPNATSKATVTTAVALQGSIFSKVNASRNGATEIVQFSLDVNQSNLETKIDRKLHKNITTLQLESGVVVRKKNDSYEAILPTGVIVKAKVVERTITVELIVDPSFRGSVSGLLGNFNGNSSDDLRNRNGTITLHPNSTEESIYPVALTWAADCNNSQESLLDYSSTPCAALFNASFQPVFTTSDLFAGNWKLKSEAMRVCGNNSRCLYDVAQTNNLNLGKATKEDDERLRAAKASEDNSPPEFELSDAGVRVRQGYSGSYFLNVTDPDAEDNVTLTVNDTAGVFSINGSDLVWATISDPELPISVTVVATDSRGQSAERVIPIQWCRCKNNSTCKWEENTTAVFTDVTCNCTRGYSGPYCDQDEDGCAANPCYTNCTDVPIEEVVANINSTEYRCGPCPPGFTGDGRTCEDINECQKSTADCEHVCTNTVGSYLCSCRPGYVPAGNRCLDIDECSIDAGVCGPNSECENTEGSYRCRCLSGYQKLTNGTCFNVIECASKTNPCAGQPNSVCKDKEGGYDCVCKFGFSKSSSGICTAINPCQPSSTCSQQCVPRLGSYKCACEEGFELSSDKRTCNALEPCSEDEEALCVGGSCARVGSKPSCVCPLGSVGRSNGSSTVCEDVNECKDKTLNRCSPEGVAVCVDASRGYKCECPKGFSLLADHLTCADEDECSTGRHTCDVVRGSCSNTNGSFECSCKPGFTEKTNATGHVTCEDIDECRTGSHRCNSSGAECVNSPGSYRCQCRRGYSGDGSVCEDVDECSDPARNPCDLENGECRNTVGSFECGCKPGFRLNGSTSCEDVNECSLGASQTGCWSAALCENSIGSYHCLCPTLMILKADGKTCEAQTRCAPDNICGSVDCALVKGQEVCLCPHGHRWSAEKRACEDVDECAKDGDKLCPKSRLVRCVNQVGSYRCDCRSPEFQRRVSATACEDKNECLDKAVWTAKCHRSSTTPLCRDVSNGFECVCPAGYKERVTEDGRCADIDECRLGLHKCHAGTKCVNTIGSYKCPCPAGYRPVGQSCVNRDGSWASWQSWSGCSQTCGGGVRTRRRSCSSPAPGGRGPGCLAVGGLQTERCADLHCPLTSLERLHAVHMTLDLSTGLSDAIFEGVLAPALRAFLWDHIDAFCNSQAGRCCGDDTGRRVRRTPGTRLTFIESRQVRFGSDSPLIRETQLTFSVLATPRLDNALCRDLYLPGDRWRRSVAGEEEAPMPVAALYSALRLLEGNETFKSHITAALEDFRMVVKVRFVAVTLPEQVATTTAPIDKSTSPGVGTRESPNSWVIPVSIILSLLVIAAAVVVVIVIVIIRRKRTNGEQKETGKGILDLVKRKAFFKDHGRQGTEVKY